MRWKQRGISMAWRRAYLMLRSETQLCTNAGSNEECLWKTREMDCHSAGILLCLPKPCWPSHTLNLPCCVGWRRIPAKLVLTHFALMGELLLWVLGITRRIGRLKQTIPRCAVRPCHCTYQQKDKQQRQKQQLPAINSLVQVGASWKNRGVSFGSHHGFLLYSTTVWQKIQTKYW